MPRHRNLTGQVFNRLTALEIAGKNKAGQYLWKVRCICGTEKVITGTALIERDAQSCGCLRVENRLKHGLSGSPEYHVWEHMKDRCLNPKNQAYSYYGGKGIIVCERWKSSFENFLADMGLKPTPKHTIDRYPDPAGNYEPGNARWASHQEQAQNKTWRSKEHYQKQIAKAQEAFLKNPDRWKILRASAAKARAALKAKGGVPRDETTGQFRPSEKPRRMR